MSVVCAPPLFVSPPRGGVDAFHVKARAVAPTEIVLHETVTRSVATTVRVLQRRKLGVHAIVGPDGDVHVYGDTSPQGIRYAHAGRHNPASIGIEVVTPYYPDKSRAKDPWHESIKARWAHRGQYLLPTPAQAEATAALVERWTAPHSSVPLRFPGLRRKRLAMSRVPALRRPSRASAGVLAHTYFGHADGAWLVLYTWLRLRAGMCPSRAFAWAKEHAAVRSRSVDLSSLLPLARVAPGTPDES